MGNTFYNDLTIESDDKHIIEKITKKYVKGKELASLDGLATGKIYVLDFEEIIKNYSSQFGDLTTETIASKGFHEDLINMVDKGDTVTVGRGLISFNSHSSTPYQAIPLLAELYKGSTFTLEWHEPLEGIMGYAEAVWNKEKMSVDMIDKYCVMNRDDYDLLGYDTIDNEDEEDGDGCHIGQRVNSCTIGSIKESMEKQRGTING